MISAAAKRAKCETDCGCPAIPSPTQDYDCATRQRVRISYGRLASNTLNHTISQSLLRNTFPLHKGRELYVNHLSTQRLHF